MTPAPTRKPSPKSRTTKTTLSLLGVSFCLAGAPLIGCSSVPVPAEADGSTRVPANDVRRVEALQQRQVANRQLLTDNNLLRAQVDVLQTKLTEMTQIVREALTLPPPAVRPQPGPVLTPQSLNVPSLPTYAYATTSAGAVVRVFYPFARTDFEPNEQIAQTLRAGLREAELIEVRGYTDGTVPNPADRRIAIERAERARVWLLANGLDPSKVRTRYFTVGHFLVENATSSGRALNRRVEIDVHSQSLLGSRVAAAAR